MSNHERYSQWSFNRAKEEPDHSYPRIIGRRVEESFARYGMEMPGSVRETIEAAREGELPKGLDE